MVVVVVVKVEVVMMGIVRDGRDVTLGDTRMVQSGGRLHTRSVRWGLGDDGRQTHRTDLNQSI